MYLAGHECTFFDTVPTDYYYILEEVASREWDRSSLPFPQEDASHPGIEVAIHGDVIQKTNILL